MSAELVPQPPLTSQERQFIALLLRSPALPDGWRSVSPFLAATVRGTASARPRLFELRTLPPPVPAPGLQVRLTAEGRVLAAYL